MRFDATIKLDQERAIKRLNYLIEKQKSFDIIVKNPKRSISQNSYMHLIFSWFGSEFGYTEKEVKQDIFKKHINSDIFYNGTKEGVVSLEKWRSTTDLTTSELTTAIDKFRYFSANEGCYLPEPNDMAAINEMERQLSKQSSKQYL